MRVRSENPQALLATWPGDDLLVLRLDLGVNMATGIRQAQVGQGTFLLGDDPARVNEDSTFRDPCWMRSLL